MSRLLSALSGWKTYLVSAATVIYAAASWWNGTLDQNAALAMIFGAAGLGALRHGVGTTLVNAAEAIAPIVIQALKKQSRNVGKVLALFAVASMLALSACANLSDPTTRVVSAEALYAAAVSAELGYLNTANPDKALVAKIEQYRQEAHDALAPLAQQAAAGQTPSADAVTLAQATVNLLVNVLTTNNIAVKGN